MAAAEQRAGLLIALEGIDGSGKSTQARRLAQALRERGIEAVVFREPGDSVHGDRLREQFEHGRTLSPEEEMRLFVEDRRIDVRDNIGPSLAAGKIVILDRYYFSTMAYQGALGIDPEAIRAENEAFAPRPDLTLVLDVAADTGVARVRGRRDVPDSYEGADYLARVRELFVSFCDGDLLRVDASSDEATVAAEIWHHVADLLRTRGLLPTGR